MPAELLIQQGTIVTATMINAPSSTKNKEKESDPALQQRRKGNQWLFGMKVPMGVDKDSSLIHSLLTSAANIGDPSR